MELCPPVSLGCDVTDYAMVYRFELAMTQSHMPKTDANLEFTDYDSDDGIIHLTDAPLEYDAFVTLGRVLEDPA